MVVRSSSGILDRVLNFYNAGLLIALEHQSALVQTARVKVLTTTAIRLNLMDAVNPRAATRENALDKFKTTRVTPPPMEATGPMAATNAAALTMLFWVSRDMFPNDWAMSVILLMMSRTTGMSQWFNFLPTSREQFVKVHPSCLKLSF